jgi:hypothetical protein
LTDRVPPQIEHLTASLARHGVKYIIFGSGGAFLYGANVSPGDLDVCPALDEENLNRLGSVLKEIKARPRVIPGWMTADASAAWTPEPPTEANLDHLFETAFGDFDVVPRPYGPNGKIDRFDFIRLSEQAVTVEIFGETVRIAGIDDLVASKLSQRRVEVIAAPRQRLESHARASATARPAAESIALEGLRQVVAWVFRPRRVRQPQLH